MSFWQAPMVVVALLTWFNAPPTSFADAAQREALRRQIMPKPTRQLSNLNLPASAFVRETAADVPPVTAAPPPDSSDDPPAPVQAAKPAQADQTAAAPAPAAAAGSDSKGDEKFWRDRMGAARQKLDEDQNLLTAMQSHINALTTDFVNRDDPAQRAKIADDRRKSLDQLDRLQKQVDADQKAIAAVQEDARRAGVPPGWVR
jgi:hypothetical protein